MCSAVDPLSAVKRRLEEHEQARINAVRGRPPSADSEATAAVLVGLFHNAADDEMSVLLTLRSTKLKRHSGEVSCPGGRPEPGDRDAVDTALREAREEIGLPSHMVDVVTQLPAHPTRGGAFVTPIVGFIPPNFSSVRQCDEVEAVFRMPLSALLDDRTHTRQTVDFRGGSFHMHSFQYADGDSGRTFRVWGFTAQICITVGSIALGRKPAFAADLWHYGVGYENVRASSKL